MSDFIAQIQARLSLTNAQAQLKSFISQCESQKIKLKLDIGNISSLAKQLQSEFQNIGKNVGASISKNINATLNGSSVGRVNAYSSVANGVKNTNDQLQKEVLRRNSILNKLNTEKYDATSSRMHSQLSSFHGQSSDNITKATSALRIYDNALNDLKRHFDSSDSFKLDDKAFNQSIKSMNTSLDLFKNSLSQVKDETSKTASALDISKVANNIQKYYTDNTLLTKEYVDALKQLEMQARNSTTEGELSNIRKQTSQLKSEIQTKGLEGKTWYSELGRGFKQIGQFALTYGIIQQVPTYISKAVRELKDMNSILTEVSKTSDLTTSQIKQLGEEAFEKASRWGKQASDYLLGVQEMSRSGFYGQQGEDMANLSVLAQAAGDMDADMSNDYLLASNAAFKYQGNVEKLNALLDGQNMITNRNSVSMEDMAAATSKAASMAAELGVQEDELSAMIGTVESRTKAGGEETGTGIKSLLINLQNLNNAKIVGTLEKAGVAMTELVDGTEQMRTPIAILEDLQRVFNSLSESDPLRAEILTNIGQKYHANQLSALLSGWSDYEKMLQDYSEGTGSAAEEANICLAA